MHVTDAGKHRICFSSNSQFLICPTENRISSLFIALLLGVRIQIATEFAVLVVVKSVIRPHVARRWNVRGMPWNLLNRRHSSLVNMSIPTLVGYARKRGIRLTIVPNRPKTRSKNLRVVLATRTRLTSNWWFILCNYLLYCILWIICFSLFCSRCFICEADHQTENCPLQSHTEKRKEQTYLILLAKLIDQIAVEKRHEFLSRGMTDQKMERVSDF